MHIKIDNELKLTKEDMDKYCGYYWNDNGNYSRKIFYKDGSIFWYRDKESITKLTPLGQNEFKFGDAEIVQFYEENCTKKMILKENDSIESFEYYEPSIPEQLILNLKQSSELIKKRRLQRLEQYDQPCITFTPLRDKNVDLSSNEIILSDIEFRTLPKSEEEIAFSSVKELAHWIQTGEISSERLTRIYLDRLKKYGDNLNTVITITEDSALKQAKLADIEIAEGKYRGLLHGIPFGLKDIFDTKDIVTTWGLDYFKKRIPDKNATVVNYLNKAGAILVAKLALGRCAGGESCHIGETKNPWNKSTDASGSSSGSGAATSAGLVAFALGSETWGSIEGPSFICGVVGLRPSFGRVPRTGVMNLCWTVDKVGSICRTVEDSVVLLSALKGSDGIDLGATDFNFSYDGNKELGKIKIGYNRRWFNEEDDYFNPKFNELFERSIISTYSSLDLQHYEFNFDYDYTETLMSAEWSTACDDFQHYESKNFKSKNDKSSIRDHDNQKLFSAVEYLHLQQLRMKLMRQVKKMFDDVDCIVIPPCVDPICGIFNLTGHPSITIPAGLDDKGMPYGITLVGKMYDEGKLLRIAKDLEIKFNFSINRPQNYKIIE